MHLEKSKRLIVSNGVDINRILAKILISFKPRATVWTFLIQGNSMLVELKKNGCGK